MVRLSFLFYLCTLFSVAKADQNIAPLSIIKSSPYMGSTLNYLTDGQLVEGENTFVLSAPLPIKLGQAVKINYQFVFPVPVAVSSLRLYQFEVSGRRWARVFDISADLDGDQTCETQLKEEVNGKSSQWMEYTFSDQPIAYQICFVTKELSNEKGPNYGGPVIGEFEIYSPTDVESVSTFGGDNRKLMSAPPVIVDGSQVVSIEKQLFSTTSLWREQFGRGVFASMWYFWEPGKAYDEYKQQLIMERLKALGVNRLWLYAGAYAKVDAPFLVNPDDELSQFFLNRKNINKEKVKITPFPSEVLIGVENNILRDFSSHLALNNIGLIANEMMLPYGKSGWDFPRVNNVKEYPSLCSKFVREKSTKLYQELMQGGVNGLALGGDEFFIYQGGDYQPTQAPICFSNGVKKTECAPECRDLFFQRYNIYPTGDLNKNFTELTAKWKVFQYQKVADWFSEYNAMMKIENPDAIATSLFRSAEQNRVGYGIAYDILGASGKIDEMSSNPYWSANSYLGHFLFSNETKKLIGASDNRRATITLQTTPFFKPKGYKDPLMVYGPAFASIMHGIKGVNFYKFDYLNVATPLSAAPIVKNIFTFTKYLESINLNDFSIARDVALLYSRASEDWWQLSQARTGKKSLLAHLTQNAVMEVLFKESIPFDLFYLDQPALWKNLNQYKVIILPFPYSIPEESYHHLKQLVSNGVKILIVNRKGEVDEFGVKYVAPLLRNAEDFKLVEIDMDNTNYDEVSNKLMTAVHNELGANGALTINADDNDLECTVHRNKNNNDQLLFCLNWEDKGYEAIFSLNLSSGFYKIDKIDMVSVRSMTKVGGSEVFNSSELRRFKLKINKGDTFVLRIQGVE